MKKKTYVKRKTVVYHISLKKAYEDEHNEQLLSGYTSNEEELGIGQEGDMFHKSLECFKKTVMSEKEIGHKHVKTYFS